jgi:transposase-like protein
MARRKFTREFKLEAVKLVKDRGVSLCDDHAAPHHPVEARQKLTRARTQVIRARPGTARQLPSMSNHHCLEAKCLLPASKRQRLCQLTKTSSKPQGLAVSDIEP